MHAAGHVLLYDVESGGLDFAENLLDFEAQLAFGNALLLIFNL